MKAYLIKIQLVLAVTILFSSCDSLKRVPEQEYLLKENEVFVNDKKADSLLKYIYQKPNRTLLGLPLRLYLYNVAHPDIDSLLQKRILDNPKRKKWLTKLLSEKQMYKHVKNRQTLNDFWKKTGEPPVILNDTLVDKSEERLRKYFFNQGWFNVKTTSKIEKKKNQNAKVKYSVNPKERYYLDSITRLVSSPKIDSILKLEDSEPLLKRGTPYITNKLTEERSRISNKLRNSGFYHFSRDYISFGIDTLDTKNKVNLDLMIKNRVLRQDDTTLTKPFNIYKVKDVNVFVDYTFGNKDENKKPIEYKGYKINSAGKLRYKPKALVNAIFIAPNTVFKDVNRTLTYRSISGLRVFKYPSINYEENADSTLTANVFLTPLKRFSFGFSAEASQSNIQALGIALNPSVLVRNVFRGAETFEISGRGSIAASKDAANNRDQFFDINELGANMKLTIPRLFSPFNTDKLIPKYMFPTTRISMAATGQTNIGLDRQTFTGTYNYKWFPNKKVTNRFDLFNVQYVRNLNTSRYFGIYNSALQRLSTVAAKAGVINQGEKLGYPKAANQFIYDVLETGDYIGKLALQDFITVNSVKERRDRLTENNLIMSSSFNYVRNSKESIVDNEFSIFRAKLELAGNTFSLLSRAIGQQKKGDDDNKRYELFNVAYSQYVKTELSFIKHWDLDNKNVVATRLFLGLAIPYGNSKNIPFSKSFFAGGANDNRAWKVYNLGPGSSLTVDEFNEANMKLAFSLEDRFNIFGDLNGAVFVDAGNIWNVLDDINTEGAKFTGLKSLKDIAIGSGIGLRYDFDFFVLRFDVGFKTYEPTALEGNKWLKKYNFSKAVYNIGINYPF